MNYHFQDNQRIQQLKQELQENDQALDRKYQDFKQLKLEQEFYQDKKKPAFQELKKPIPKTDHHSLADQIFQGLIGDPQKQRYHQNLPPPQRANIPYQQKPAHPLSPAKKQQPFQPMQPQRQNYIMNQRELQKNKLQNQKHEGLFPNSSDHNKIRSLGKQQVVPQQDRKQSPKNQRNFRSPQSPQKNQYRPKFDPSYNPFVPNEEQQRQKKDEKHRQYLKELEEQRVEHQRERKRRQKQQRQYKADLIDFAPQVQAVKVEQVKEKPLVMKRVDPNSTPPKIKPIMGNYSQFDKNLIKSKIIELKAKYKRGKVNFEEYQREMNNLKKQYPGQIEQLLEDQPKQDHHPLQYRIPQQKILSPQKDIKSNSHLQELQDSSRQKFPIKSQSINYSQFMPSMVQQPQTHPAKQPQAMNFKPEGVNFQQFQGMVPPSYLQGVPPTEYMQLLKNMFELMCKQFRDVRSEQNHVLHQTLNKFLLMSSQQNMLTQNSIPPIQHANMQKDFYSDVKMHREYFGKESDQKKKNVVSSQNQSIPFGESDNSEYYEHSLSAIASKVPLSRRINTTEERSRQEKRDKRSVLDQFFNKKYKVKPIKKFNILIDASQSQAEVPSTSNYLRAKNAKQELKIRFQEDLAEMKSLQSNKAFKKTSERMEVNISYKERRSQKEKQSKILYQQPYQSKVTPFEKHQKVQGNPYLKKNISGNQEKILTFNERELKLNSPSGYSPVNKKEIMEQDEYQTEPRVREEKKGASQLIEDYQHKISQPKKALDFIQMNDRLLSKYQHSEESKKESGISDSKDYFSNNQLSPVKSPQHYSQSLQTIRSQLVSVKQSHRPHLFLNKDPQPRESNINSVQNEMMQYSQTVESVEESSSKLRKPPLVKRKSVGKKKQNSISRSKIQPQMIQNNKISESASFDPNYPKFQSNVYQSQYEQSVDTSKFPKIDPLIILNKAQPQEVQSQIVFEQPKILTPKGQQMFVEQSKQKVFQSKLKSLEEARKLAKQCRVKAEENKQYKSVEQRFSELQSFMSKKDQSIHGYRQTPSQLARQKEKIREGKVREQSRKSDRKNIMKLLEELQDENEGYKQQFQSYREQSEAYQ